jgi:uncharacterized membrane protein (UPF0127 family)
MRCLAFAVVVLLLSACGGTERSPRAIIQTSDGEVTVQVEIADTSAERARGLMGRTKLADDAGMVFSFPQDSTSAFWMKDTLIPLSIAFYGTDGRIVRILDMAPCRRDPCPVYEPRATYRGALEVNQGAFRRWGVEVNDTLRVIGNG